MKPPPFAYRDPATLGEALALLAANVDARPLAGGQSLVPMLNFRLVHPPMIVDLNRIGALAGIVIGADAATIGAMTRQRDAERDMDLARAWPLIIEALRHVGHIQTRSRGTIGGSLAHNDPAAELPAVMLALDATMSVQSARGGRKIASADFFVSTLTTALDPGELLVSIDLPRPPRDAGFGFAELARRHGDFALAAAAVVVSRAGGGHARIALTGMGDGPRRALEAEAALVEGGFSDAAIAVAVAAASAAVKPIDDLHAPAWYRKKVAGVMAARACRDAIARMAS
ncbi:MAG: xanthine dehydrogenase family protein subunit M [Alphaproteobacteria bacterium]|nr:xanthine dehydrogenase family protein subunit M [Alphaproteobacteria bacterium]